MAAYFQYQQRAEPSPAAYLTPPMTVEWLPTYPSWFPPPSRHAALSAITVWIPQHDAAEGSGLQWLPKMPDWIPAPPSLRSGAQLVEAQNLDPIPRPAPPTELTWQGSAPVWIAPLDTVRQTPAALRAPAFVIGQPAVSDLRWLPSMPAWIAARPRNRAVWPHRDAREVGALLDLPKIGGWRPIAPASIPRMRVLRPLGGYVSPPAPLTLLDGAFCVELTSETLINPAMIEEFLLPPRLLDEILIRPMLTDEEIC